MYRKLTFIVALIFLILLCTSSVCADDLNSTDFDDLATQINAAPEHIEIDEDNNAINTSEVLGVNADDGAIENINHDDSFEGLSKLIDDTSEGGILTLTNDYKYVNGSNKGILINKTITVDGNGHTLDGNHLSRMFNVTGDNVVIKNINFINGNAYGRYFSNNVGGGAIYWSGSDGCVENCNFTNNTGNGLEEDPYEKDETFVDENGTVWQVFRVRPMGVKINEGGAIVWNGTNGTVLRCTFTNNNVGYPNSGGAICWRGDSGKVLESRFYRNNAWSGAAISWLGNNGAILYSKFFNTGGIFSRDLMWFGDNGSISYSILASSSGTNPLRVYSENFTADYNFWGDIIGNAECSKIGNLKNWVVLNATYDKGFIVKGQTVTVNCSVLLYENGVYSNFTLFDTPDNVSVKADKSGFIKVSYKDGKILVDIIPKTKILSGNLKKYYGQSKYFKVRVFASDGNPAIGQYVKFIINKKTYEVKTNKKGYATLKLNLKPGKYKVTTKFDGIKVKNKIKVKTTLITKNVSKKVKKSAKFKVKVLTSKGKKYSKKLVKIKFKGKLYKIKTNKKGIAKLKLPNNLKVGKHTIKTYCNGLKNTNMIIVKK